MRDGPGRCGFRGTYACRSARRSVSPRGPSFAHAFVYRVHLRLRCAFNHARAPRPVVEIPHGDVRTNSSSISCPPASGSGTGATCSRCRRHDDVDPGLARGSAIRLASRPRSIGVRSTMLVTPAARASFRRRTRAKSRPLVEHLRILLVHRRPPTRTCSCIRVKRGRSYRSGRRRIGWWAR